MSSTVSDEFMCRIVSHSVARKKSVKQLKLNNHLRGRKSLSAVFHEFPKILFISVFAVWDHEFWGLGFRVDYGWDTRMSKVPEHNPKQ